MHSRHAERADRLRGALGEAGGLVWGSRLSSACSARPEVMCICGEPPARQVAVGPWRAGANHLKHACPKGSNPDIRKRAHSIRDIHAHAWVTLSNRQRPPHATCIPQAPIDLPKLRPSPTSHAAFEAHGGGGLGPRQALLAKQKLWGAKAGQAMATRAAGHSRRRGDQIARSLLSSLRRSAAANGQWSKPAKGISKRSASAGTWGNKDLEQERAPGGTPRGRCCPA